MQLFDKITSGQYTATWNIKFITLQHTKLY
jgi:hypothetical protein